MERKDYYTPADRPLFVHSLFSFTHARESLRWNVIIAKVEKTHWTKESGSISIHIIVEIEIDSERTKHSLVDVCVCASVCNVCV